MSTQITRQQGALLRIEAFRRLHESGCFVIPNPWDVGSARLLVQLGFRALATTSSGFAWSTGRADAATSLEDTLEHARLMAEAVSAPVSLDFQDGFAADPAGVQAHVAAATETGVAGVSIEDSTRDGAEPLYAFSVAVERVAAARSGIDQSGVPLLLTARTEGYVRGRPDLEETTRRLVAYSEAGADCLYAPGLRSLDEIEAVVRAVAPKPVNVLVGSDFSTVAELAKLGVRRISVGGALARAAWAAFLAAALEIAERGTFSSLAGAVSFAEIEGRFARPS